MRSIKIFLTGYACFFMMKAYTQNFDSVDVNNMRLIIEPDGYMPYEIDDEIINALIVPIDVEAGAMRAGTIFTCGLWIGGMDDGGQLHLAAQTYRQSGKDFWFGPIADNYTTPEYEEKYDHVWVVDKATIDEHIINYSEVGYVVPESINLWPGNGNTANGEAAQLAPYYDYNANEMYDPENGDYPIIRGDEAAFFIFNDAKDVHAESGGEVIGIEIHGMAYAFDNISDSALWHTMFINYSIINRSENNYDSIYTGFWTDFDIGCYDDDWIGCDSNTNLYYCYNGDLADNPCPFGFGSILPAQASMFLNENMSSFLYYNNDPSVTGNPETPEDYYNYLHATWKDNSPVTFGGDGYGGTEETNFMFPDQPGDFTGWSELTEANIPADRRGVGSAGPFTLPANTSICLDLAMPFAVSDSLEDEPLGFAYNWDAVTELIKRAGVIQEFYDTNFSACAIETIINEDYVPEDTTVHVLLSEDSEIEVYPNPVSDILFLNLKNGNKYISAQLIIVNALGEIVYAGIVSGNDKITLHLKNFQPGIYQYQFLNEQDVLAGGNFMKE